MTTVEKFKALLKAKSNNEVESILKKCTLDEMKKFALVLKLDIEKISRHYAFDIEASFIEEVLTALDMRRFHKELARKWEKKAA
ncbi:MAG: hypothetical protein IJ597_03770 [Synergistaceae bacterium]|nr:hypothetical protein [Synergistaceae bacterium]